jgi:glucose/arabinose dehydrogenase
LINGLGWPPLLKARAETALPPGFTVDTVVTGVVDLTTIAWAPDGRMFIAQKDGKVRVFHDDKLLPGNFIDISDQVNDYFEHGLVGIAVHPDFPNTPYVYLAFTYDPPGVEKDGIGQRVSRLIRVSADPNNLNQALPGSEVVLLGANSIRENIGDEKIELYIEQPPEGAIQPESCLKDGKPVQDCLPVDSITHTIGAVLVGPEGDLYVASGDGAEIRFPDPRALRALNLDSLAGKILRIDPLTGNGYADNPFYDGDPTHDRSKVWAYGLRNPFRFAIQAGTGDVFIGDVGWHSWEEINTGRGKNFGWPCYEGDGAGSAKQSEYQLGAGTKSVCQELYALGPSAVEAPLYSYFHSQQIAAIIMGDFYRGTLYPATYQGALFFADFIGDTLKYLTFDRNGKATVNDFATDLSPIGGVTQVISGPDTNLYYVILNGKDSEVRRIRYTAAVNTPPVAQGSATPTSSPAPVSSQATPASAPTAAPFAIPLPTPLEAETGNLVSFVDLGVQERILRGPFDSLEFSFSLPANWQLAEGQDIELRLDLTSFFSSLGIPQTSSQPSTLGGSLEVYFNRQLVTTLLLTENGDQTLSVLIPPEVQIPVRDDGRYELELTLKSDTSCEAPQQSSVVVHSTSLLIIPHQIVQPSTDLTRLPQPIYLDSFSPDVAIVVVPDKPNAAELQAALAVAAGFGEMTNSNLEFYLVPLNHLSAEVRAAAHLIFVGLASSFPLLKDADLPAPTNGQQFMASGAGADDGIIQMAVSPWNPAKVLLIVGGNSDVAIVKAGGALSSGLIRPGGQPNLALVADVRPGQITTVVKTDQTFGELGFVTETQRRRDSIFNLSFYVPSGKVLSGEAYIDLIFKHSAVLDTEVSGLVATWNGQPIGSSRLTEETAAKGAVRLYIPPSAIQSGLNQLRVSANLRPRNDCKSAQVNDFWFSIQSESVFHLPLSESLLSVKPNFSLSDYPEQFTKNPFMNNVAFVLAHDDPVGWNVAAHLAFDLGNNANVDVAELVAVFGDGVPDEMRKERNLLIVGQPVALPIVAELSGVMPAPFEAGSNIASELGSAIVYRVPDGVSIGYLQLFPSPWNDERAVLAVLGNTDEGVQWAGAALIRPDLRNQLNGRFAIVKGEQITVDSAQAGLAPGNLISTAVPNSAPEPTASVGSADTAVGERPAWVLPLLIVSTVLILVIIAVVVISSLKRRAAMQQFTDKH